jgi:hypothetical protein
MPKPETCRVGVSVEQGIGREQRSYLIMIIGGEQFEKPVIRP